jgi:quercetin dioxygenase-like cupin family protein
MNKEVYPKMIKDLPEVDIPFKGVKGWVLQGVDKQLVFFDIEPIAQIPEHSHGEQWGIVVEGEMELTISGLKKVYQKGDGYYIPAGALHSVTFKTRTKVIDLFADVNRYNPKPKQ